MVTGGAPLGFEEVGSVVLPEVLVEDWVLDEHPARAKAATIIDKLNILKTRLCFISINPTTSYLSPAMPLSLKESLFDCQSIKIDFWSCPKMRYNLSRTETSETRTFIMT